MHRLYKVFLTAITIILLAQPLFSQDKKTACNCPQQTNTTGKADRIFNLDGKQIGVCGYVEVEKKDTLYSEFILFQCGQRQIIEEWDATQTCQLLQKKDTLFVNEYYGLAIGKNLSIRWVPFYKNLYYFKDSKLVHKAYYRDDLPKYNSAQIQSVLHQYQQQKRDINNYDSVLLIAHRLFWAYVSGSKQAGIYLDAFEKKFGPFDGGNAEEFEELIAMFDHWKQEHRAPKG